MDSNEETRSVQVLLDREQQEYLNRLSNKTGQNISELTKQLLEERIREIKGERLMHAARELRAVYAAQGELTEFTQLDSEDWHMADVQEGREKAAKKPEGSQLTNSQKILGAVKRLMKDDTGIEFSRNTIRLQLGVSSHEWLNSYTAIFQAMRSDHPGGAPPISEKYQGVFKRIRRSTYVLTEKGENLIKSL